MIWHECILLSANETNTDDLGNSIVQYVPIKNTKARATPWMEEDIDIEGREVTQNQQRYILPINFDTFPKCEAIEINSHILEIKEVVDLSPRYTMIYAHKEKNEHG